MKYATFYTLNGKVENEFVTYTDLKQYLKDSKLKPIFYKYYDSDNETHYIVKNNKREVQQPRKLYNLISEYNRLVNN